MPQRSVSRMKQLVYPKPFLLVPCQVDLLSPLPSQRPGSPIMRWEEAVGSLQTALGEQTGAEVEAYLMFGIVLAAASHTLIRNTRTDNTLLFAPTRTLLVYVSMSPRILRRCKNTARRSTSRIRRGRILGPPTFLTLMKQVSSAFESNAWQPWGDTK